MVIHVATDNITVFNALPGKLGIFPVGLLFRFISLRLFTYQMHGGVFTDLLLDMCPAGNGGKP